MPLVSPSKMLCLLVCLLVFRLSIPKLAVSQGPEAANGLTSEEKEALQKARDSEEQLKRYLDIANDRLKTLLAATNKGDQESAAKAVTGYRTAVAGAEDSVARMQASGKNTKKAITTLFKAVKKYNFTLLQALDKAPEDARTHIQFAFEESTRVQQGLSIQMEKIEKK